MPIPLTSQPAPRPPRTPPWLVLMRALGLAVALFLLGFRTWELAALLAALVIERWYGRRR